MNAFIKYATQEERKVVLTYLNSKVQDHTNEVEVIQDLLKKQSSLLTEATKDRDNLDYFIKRKDEEESREMLKGTKEDLPQSPVQPQEESNEQTQPTTDTASGSDLDIDRQEQVRPTTTVAPTTGLKSYPKNKPTPEF